MQDYLSTFKGKHVSHIMDGDEAAGRALVGDFKPAEADARAVQERATKAASAAEALRLVGELQRIAELIEELRAPDPDHPKLRTITRGSEGTWGYSTESVRR